MATRTAKGAATAKASSTTVTLSSVSLTEGHSVFAIVGGHGTGVPSVDAGTRTMNKVIQRVDNTASFNATIHYIRRIKNGNTRDFVATFPSAVTAKSLIVLTLDIPVIFFEGAGNIQNTASPTTSANLLDLPVHDCFHLAGMIHEGPDSDAVLTPPTDWNTGQRDGTVGAPPISNVTAAEFWKIGRCIDPEEMDATGTETRDWCNVLATFKPLPVYPFIDGDGTEIEVGDTVEYNATNYTVNALYSEQGAPIAYVQLGVGGPYVQAYKLLVVD